MVKKVQLSIDELKEIKKLLEDNLSSAILFGSRVSGTAKKFSDLDMCLKFPLSIRNDRKTANLIMSDLREKFDNSNLPFVVDLSRYEHLPEAFQKQIDKEGVLVSEAESV